MATNSSPTIEPNNTQFCNESDPSAREWMDEIFSDPSLTAWFYVIIACTVVVFLFYVESLYHVGTKVSHKGRRLSILWILSMCPVFCLTSLLGFCLPRGIMLCNIMAALFYVIGLYFFLLLIIYYYGGDEATIMKLTDMEVPLLFCCKKPKVTLNEMSLFWLKMAIGQFTVIRCALLYLEAMLWMDGTLNVSKIAWNDASLYIYTITILSAVVAMYGLFVFLYASRKHLFNYYITPKVWIMVAALFISNLQVVILGILASVNVLSCIKLFHTEMRANYWQSLLLTLEATLLFPIVLLYFRTKKGNVISILEIRQRPSKRSFFRKSSSKTSLYNTYSVL